MTAYNKQAINIMGGYAMHVTNAAVPNTIHNSAISSLLFTCSSLIYDSRYDTCNAYYCRYIN